MTGVQTCALPILDGTFTEHQITKEKWKTASPGNLKQVFVTDSAICYISSKYGNEAHPKKKAEEKLILFKVQLDGYKEKKINLKLPKLTTEPKKTDFWYYKDHDEEGIYFASLFEDKAGKGIEFSCNIVKMSYNGILLKETKISIKKEGIARVNQWKIILDKENSSIYICALEQLKLNVKENDQRNLSITKYDYDGNMIWGNKIEGLSAGNGYLPIDLFIQKNQDIHLELKGRNIQVIWEFTSKGESIKNYSTNLTEIVDRKSVV